MTYSDIIQIVDKTPVSPFLEKVTEYRFGDAHTLPICDTGRDGAETISGIGQSRYAVSGNDSEPDDYRASGNYDSGSLCRAYIGTECNNEFYFYAIHSGWVQKRNDRAEKC